MIKLQINHSLKSQVGIKQWLYGDGTTTGTNNVELHINEQAIW